MKIQLNTDGNTDGTEALAAQVSASVEQAVQGAAQKLAHLLDSTLGRLHEHREKNLACPCPGRSPCSADDPATTTTTLESVMTSACVAS